MGYETFKFFYGLHQPSASPTFSGGTQPLAVLTNIFLVQSLHVHDGLTWNGPSWSISTEVWTYVVFALLSAWLGMRNWMLLIAAIAAPVLLFHLSKTGMDTTYDYGLIRCIFGFALGVVCFRIHSRWPHAHAHQEPALMSVLELLTVAGVVAFVSAAGTTAWSFLAPFVFTAAVLVFAVEGGVVSRLFRAPLLKWLGKLSYSIYLTHYAFVELVPPVIRRLAHQDLWTPMPLPNGQYVLVFGRNNLEGALVYAGVLALTLAFSAFTYRWVETPGREWTRRWVNRPSAPRKTVTDPQ
jgi:peptidoglycan/LPS O-acetylase OafA/YrhL